MKRYTIDPVMISLDEFQDLTATRRMLPGRIVLHEHMEERFGLLKRSGAKTLADLIRLLGSKAKIKEYAARAGLDIHYLVLLKREACSYIARPFPLSGFPGIPFEYLEILQARGIRNTGDLFEQVQSERQQDDLSASTGIPAYRLNELFTLCELTRVTGVGGIFARVLFEAGIRSIADFAGADCPALLERCRSVIEKNGYTIGTLGEMDISYVISYAKIVLECDQKSDSE